jgi:hypothetical protein
MTGTTHRSTAHRGLPRSIAFFALLLALGGWTACRGDEPVPSAGAVPETPSAPPSPIARVRAWGRGSIARIREREAVQMISAVLSGSQMGPGDGWFHPGKSRYGWDWLARRYDGDGDGTVTAEEFTGPTELFERLDRDRDGELNRGDFDWSDGAPFVRQQGMAGQWFARIDKSSNGRITAEEWQQFFEKLAGEKGYVSREDLRAGLFPAAPKTTAPPPGQQGPSVDVLLEGILTGELGSMLEGPAIDDQAPDFELETQAGDRRYRLSSFRGEKPVVLIFGSFT